MWAWYVDGIDSKHGSILLLLVQLLSQKLQAAASFKTLATFTFTLLIARDLVGQGKKQESSLMCPGSVTHRCHFL